MSSVGWGERSRAASSGRPVADLTAAIKQAEEALRNVERERLVGHIREAAKFASRSERMVFLHDYEAKALLAMVDASRSLLSASRAATAQPAPLSVRELICPKCKAEFADPDPAKEFPSGIMCPQCRENRSALVGVIHPRVVEQPAPLEEAVRLRALIEDEVRWLQGWNVGGVAPHHLGRADYLLAALDRGGKP